MKKNKLLLQIGTCLVISLAILGCKNLDNPNLNQLYDRTKKMVMYEVTREDISAVWEQMATSLAGAPFKVVSAVTEVHETSKYGQPIDKKSTTRILQVHAVAGGVVEKSGMNDKYGLYIQIKHENAVTIYGNLSGIGVVEAERIQRGEIIGSYDTLDEKEFYYELREDL